jgi:hypothetical protein
MADERNRYQLSEEDQELFDMPLQDLRRLVGFIDGARIGDQELWEARKRTPEEQHVVNVWHRREVEIVRDENRIERSKMLRGEPNDFDAYGPY